MIARFHRGIVALTVAATLLAFTGEAAAQEPSDSSAVDQYVEDVPTGEGSSPVGKKEADREPLPRDVQNQVATEGGGDAPVLTAVATSAAYGAPQKRLRKAEQKARKEDPVRHARPDEPGAALAAERNGVSAAATISAVGTTVTGENAGRLLLILIAISAISVAALAAGLRQRRSAL